MKATPTITFSKREAPPLLPPRNSIPSKTDRRIALIFKVANQVPPGPVPFPDEDSIILEGGKEAGDWDELDFTLEAVPIEGRVDPGTGFHGGERGE